MKIAEEYNYAMNQSDSTRGLIQFTLLGSKKCPHETSTKLITDTGGIFVQLKWTPAQLEGNTNENLTIQFSDAASESSLMSNVKYDFTVSDGARNTVLQKENLTAHNATDNLFFRLPADGEYPIEIFVKQLVTNSSSGPIEDSTRSGRAIGYVVVPEFESTYLAVVGAVSITSVIVFARHFRFQRM